MHRRGTNVQMEAKMYAVNLVKKPSPQTFV